MAGKRGRAAVVLVLMGGLALAAMTAPINAAKPSASKQFVKKQIKKVKNQLNSLSSNVIHQPLYYRQSDEIEVSAGSQGAGSVACPPGTQALGGGVSPTYIDGFTQYYDVEIRASHPSDGATNEAGTTGWAAGVEDSSPGNAFTFRVYVICAGAQADGQLTTPEPPAS